jgi:hypothetical protein
MPIGSGPSITRPGSAALVAGLLLAASSARSPAALAQRVPSITMSSSVQTLKASRPAGAAKLPEVQRQREGRTFAVISRLPLVLQEAYLVTLHDYPNLPPADQKQFLAIVDSLGFLPKNVQSRAADLLNAQFPAKVSAEKIAKARSHPHETCFLINTAIARAKAQIRR